MYYTDAGASTSIYACNILLTLTLLFADQVRSQVTQRHGLLICKLYRSILATKPNLFIDPE